MEQKDISTSSILEHIWNDQKRFNSNFIKYKELTQEQRVKFTKEYSLLLIDEIMELIGETNWKSHRKNKEHFVESNLKEEWIDIFKYWLSIGLIWGFNPYDFIEEYQRKSSVVEQRYKQEKQLEFKANKVVGVDIDGVLAAYPEHFLDFVNRKMGTDYSVESLTNYDIYEALDLPENVTKELKDKFRQSGEKRFIPITEGAREFLKKLRKNGYQIVLLSARPYKKYRRIFADTKEWLEKNNLVHDAILWDEDKCARLIREFGTDKVKFFVEDNLENANDVADVSKVYLLDKSYNKGKIKENVVRIDDLEQIIKMEGVKND
ncbi:MAG TPA: dUTP diphosphatase [Candidatus Nanoarchaeia archaeon]|nr:dUTP diphosphatase [Candidatus Nanoarchaeia archaeon]